MAWARVATGVLKIAVGPGLKSAYLFVHMGPQPNRSQPATTEDSRHGCQVTPPETCAMTSRGGCRESRRPPSWERRPPPNSTRPNKCAIFTRQKNNGPGGAMLHTMMDNVPILQERILCYIEQVTTSLSPIAIPRHLRHCLLLLSPMASSPEDKPAACSKQNFTNENTISH